LYDLKEDPHQLRNLADALEAEQADAFAAVLAGLATCAGPSCRMAEDVGLPVL
jgi:hypothetical protein